MKKVLTCINNTIALIAIGLLIGLYIKPNDVNRFQVQKFFNTPQAPKMLIDSKTGDVWVLIIKDGYEWKQIRTGLH